MLNILLSSFIMSYATKFLSQIYNPTYINSNLNLQNNPDMDDSIPKDTNLDIKTIIPFKNLINVSIEDTNKHLEEANYYTIFLERYSNW